MSLTKNTHTAHTLMNTCSFEHTSTSLIKECCSYNEGEGVLAICGHSGNGSFSAHCFKLVTDHRAVEHSTAHQLRHATHRLNPPQAWSLSHFTEHSTALLTVPVNKSEGKWWNVGISKTGCGQSLWHLLLQPFCLIEVVSVLGYGVEAAYRPWHIHTRV